MKTYSIDIFLSTGMVIRMERLSPSKLKELKAIFNEESFDAKNCRYVFKHEGCRHFFKPAEVAHYVTKKVLL